MWWWGRIWSTVVGSIANTIETLPERVMAQPRYRAPAVAARCLPMGEGRVELLFDEPVRALAPGQVCAFYAPDAGRGERLLGGGFFGSCS